MEEVRAVLADPRCYWRMRDDLSPSLDSVSPLPLPQVRYVMAEEEERFGVFLLCGDETRAEVHFCLLPSTWGWSDLLAHCFLAWAWQNTALRVLSALVPNYNRLALKLALKVGFREKAKMLKSGTKDGKWFDLHVLELERPKEYALCA